MPRPRHPKRDSVKESWLISGGKLTTKELALEAGVPESRIRKWKSEDKWKDELNKNKRGGQPGNKNAVGNGPPKGNKNAETHGAYSTVHLEDLPPTERVYIESITLDTRENMLRELQLLIAKERDLKKKISKLDNEAEDILHTDRVVDMVVPNNKEKLKSDRKKLDELIVKRDNLAWEMEGKSNTSKKDKKKLDKLEQEVVILQDKISNEEEAGNKGPMILAMQTITKASSFERAMKLEAELNKTHGRIIKLLDSIKSYELDCRRVELEEKKYRLSKQKLTGSYDINPETGEIIDNSDDIDIE